MKPFIFGFSLGCLTGYLAMQMAVMYPFLREGK